MYKITQLIANRTARQTLLLFSAQIFSLGIGFIANMLLAKEMGVQQFGIYSFTLATISFVAIFFEFGYFASGARLLAQNHDKVYEKELIAALLVIAGIIAMGFVVTIFALSFVVDEIFADKIGEILRLASIVSFSFILPFFMELVLKGSNHIEYLSLFHFIWKVLFMILLIFLYIFEIISPIAIILILSTGCILAFLIISFNLRPLNSRTRKILIKLHRENKRYGFHVYTARIADTATFQLDRLMISFFVGSTSVGFYSLAFALASPLNTFSTALSSSKFKSFSNGKAVPNNILIANFIWILIASLGIITVGYFIVYSFLGIAYAEVFPLLIVLICAVFFQASYQPYNAWICSAGFGKEVKIKTYITTFINILFNILLIPYYGALGAAIASLISMFASFVIYFYLHSKLARKLI